MLLIGALISALRRWGVSRRCRTHSCTAMLHARLLSLGRGEGRLLAGRQQLGPARHRRGWRIASTLVASETENEERRQWQSSVRSLTGRRKHRLWEPELLDPPALLGDVAVVLQSPKNPNSVGSVARSASSFECEDIRLVKPRCNHLARSARNSSKGAQYLLWRAQTYNSLQEAAADAAVTVAFTRWVQGRSRAFKSPSQLFAAPELQHLFLRPNSSVGAGPPNPPGKVLFVFGREESGLTEEEIASCDYVCSIPIGRLQESLSLSHAVSLVFSQLFELRLGHSGAVPSTIEELAAGCPGDESGGE